GVWVIVTGFPRLTMSMMIFGAGTPSAWERSRTVAPDGTVTGPVGATASRGCFGRWSRSRAWRAASRGRSAPVSMTTRRFRRPAGAPWRGRSGRFGRPERDSSAMCVSVKPRECRIDFHGRPQHAVERSARAGPLEALQAPAGVDAPSGPLRGGLQHAVPRDEALE